MYSCRRLENVWNELRDQYDCAQRVTRSSLQGPTHQFDYCQPTHVVRSKTRKKSYAHQYFQASYHVRDLSPYTWFPRKAYQISLQLVFRARSWISRSDQSKLVEGWDMEARNNNNNMYILLFQSKLFWFTAPGDRTRGVPRAYQKYGILIGPGCRKNEWVWRYVLLLFITYEDIIIISLLISSKVIFNLIIYYVPLLFREWYFCGTN